MKKRVTGRDKLIEWAKTATAKELVKYVACLSDIGLRTPDLNACLDQKITCEECWQKALDMEQE